MKRYVCDICGAVMDGKGDKGQRYSYCPECKEKTRAYVAQMQEVFNTPMAPQAFSYLLRSVAKRISPPQKRGSRVADKTETQAA